jgi:hypothetical protein
VIQDGTAILFPFKVRQIPPCERRLTKLGSRYDSIRN